MIHALPQSHLTRDSMQSLAGKRASRSDLVTDGFFLPSVALISFHGAEWNVSQALEHHLSQFSMSNGGPTQILIWLMATSTCIQLVAMNGGIRSVAHALIPHNACHSMFLLTLSIRQQSICFKTILVFVFPVNFRWPMRGLCGTPASDLLFKAWLCRDVILWIYEINCIAHILYTVRKKYKTVCFKVQFSNGTEIVLLKNISSYCLKLSFGGIISFNFPPLYIYCWFLTGIGYTHSALHFKAV